MIDRLGRDFVSTWMLAKDLDRMKEDQELSEEVRAFAARMRAAYTYPVDSQIYSPDGELLRRVAANDLPEDASGAYLELLGPSLQR